MTRGFFNWTAEDVVRFLKDNGFILDHTRGSHWYYVGHHHNRVYIVTVPFHGTRAIKPRTLKGIITQSGIPKEQWLNR